MSDIDDVDPRGDRANMTIVRVPTSNDREITNLALLVQVFQGMSPEEYVRATQYLAERFAPTIREERP